MTSHFISVPFATLGRLSTCLYIIFARLYLTTIDKEKAITPVPTVLGIVYLSPLAEVLRAMALEPPIVSRRRPRLAGILGVAALWCVSVVCVACRVPILI